MRSMPSPKGTNNEKLYLPSGSSAEAAYDAEGGLVDEAGRPMCDSATAHRILSAVKGVLDEKDFGAIVVMMEGAGLISEEESRTISEQASGGPDDDMASDAAYRAHVMANRRAQVRSGQRSVSCLHDPIMTPREIRAQEEAHRSFAERFLPHNNRLK